MPRVWIEFGFGYRSPARFCGGSSSSKPTFCAIRIDVANALSVPESRKDDYDCFGGWECDVTEKRKLERKKKA